MKVLQYIIAVVLQVHCFFIIGVGEERKVCEQFAMVIVIPSYNNSKWYKRNLDSVLSQNYTNFRVVYTDDCSTDGTGDLVEQYLLENDIDKKVRLVRNNINRGPLHNMYTMVHECEDHEIVINLDGDDWFPDKDVLSRLNAVYASDEIWMTYGQFQYSSSGETGWAAPMSDYLIQSNTFRKAQQIPTHLRTFYAWLFKKIKLKDLMYMGKFYPRAGDCAMLFALIEMAGERHKFIPDIMYVYNDENGISEHHRSRQLQMHLAQVIRDKKCYTRLVRKPVCRKKGQSKADVIIFAQRPQELIKLLDSLETYGHDIDHIAVMYDPISLVEYKKFNVLQTLYPHVEFNIIDSQGIYFGSLLFDIFVESPNEYVLFIKGDAVLDRSVSLSECIDAMEQTGAFAFYFKLNTQAISNIPFIECKNNIYAWNFSVALDKWSSANSLDFVLHKKEGSLFSTLGNYHGPDVEGIEEEWVLEGQLDRVGLCFDESCITVLS